MWPSAQCVAIPGTAMMLMDDERGADRALDRHPRAPLEERARGRSRRRGRGSPEYAPVSRPRPRPACPAGPLDPGARVGGSAAGPPSRRRRHAVRIRRPERPAPRPRTAGSRLGPRADAAQPSMSTATQPMSTAVSSRTTVPPTYRVARAPSTAAGTPHRPDQDPGAQVDETVAPIRPGARERRRQDDEQRGPHRDERGEARGSAGWPAS